MRRLTLPLTLSLLTLVGLAQTALSPTPIDWRYRFDWDDPNAVGLVASWTIYASNNVAWRSTTTRNLTVDLSTLLNGTPAGTYALFGVPVSQLGDIGEAGTNLFVAWPGGNGKLKGPVNSRVGK
jgi:hypothetical protein